MMKGVLLGGMFTCVATLVFWGVVPKKMRIGFLSALSLGILFGLDTALGFSILILATLVAIVSGHPEWCRRLSAWILAFLVAGLICLKLTVFESFPLFGQTAPTLLYSLGASFFCFRAIHLVVQASRGELNNSFSERFLYLVFFPVFLAGPFTRVSAFFESQKENLSASEVSIAVQRITLGLFKKCFVLGVVFHFAVDRWAVEVLERGGASFEELAALASFAFLKAYFDLSAYTDLAVGLSKLLGFTVSENFLSPFWQPNLAAFWRAWHRSLGLWCRDHVYLPLLGFTRKPWLAVAATMAVMGLWHALDLKWSVWALYHTLGLIAYAAWSRFMRRGIQIPFPRWLVHPLSCAVTFLYVAFGYLLVSANSLQHFIRLVR